MKISKLFVGLNALVLATAGAIAGSFSSNAVGECDHVLVDGFPEELGFIMEDCSTIISTVICTYLGPIVVTANGSTCYTIDE